jgi:hypothetical protein
MMRGAVAAYSIALVGAAVACGKPVDLKQTLQVVDATGGWFDAGIVEGRNKLVPTIAFRLRKSTDQTLRPLSLNVVFKRLPPADAPANTAEEDWEEVYVQSVTFEGSQTAPMTVRPNHGYTGEPPQSRADMLKNTQFRDIRIHIFAKHSSSQWTEIHQYDLPRQLLTR